MPIYVRAGAIIPLDPVRQYISEPVTEPTTLQIYPGANGELTLYDDDGESLGYLDGSDPKTTWLRAQWDDHSRRLSIEPDRRMNKWRGNKRKFTVKIAGSAVSKTIAFGGLRETVAF
jgi:alpha-glucosidase/alpha-D-xyloside xylohydrolase